MTIRHRRRRLLCRTIPAHADIAAALREGRCAFAALGDCAASPPSAVGLRGPDDVDAILCCSAHAQNLTVLRRRNRDSRLLASRLHAEFSRKLVAA